MKMSTGGGCFGVRDSHFVDALSKPMGYFGEVQVNQENGGESLDSIRDDSKEIGMKMSTGGGRFGVRDSHFVDSCQSLWVVLERFVRIKKMVESLLIP